MFRGTDITRMPCSWRHGVTVFTEELLWLKGRDLELVHGRSPVQLRGLAPSRLSAAIGRGRKYEALCNLPHERERRRPYSRQKVAARREPHGGAVRAPARVARRRLLAHRPGDRQRIRQGRFLPRAHRPDLSAGTLVRATVHPIRIQGGRCRRPSIAWGIALDAQGKIAWGRSDIGGDPIVVALVTAPRPL